METVPERDTNSARSCQSFKSRRDFLKAATSSAVFAGAAGVAAAPLDQQATPSPVRPTKPNIVLYVADQVRWDFVGAYGANSNVQTPNLNRIAEKGVLFTNAITNQPLCSPSRACMLTGRYATETGMWKLPPGAQLRSDLPTLATVLRANGYSANFIGKWHLAPVDRGDSSTFGFVPAEYRGGFLDFWEGANVLEHTSNPYSGTIWDRDGNPITFSDQYRADFITDRAVRFLKTTHDKPFLLMVSQLEPHHQNSEDRTVAPKGYAERYQNPFVPSDLLHLPGVWQEQLPGYYGAIERIDQSVGTLLRTLEEENLTHNTIFVFTSDHGSHFKTRNSEYKRSPHDSSVRVPLLMQGPPPLNSSLRIDQLVSHLDLTPALLDLADVPIPPSMKGKSWIPLLDKPDARTSWNNAALIQISESMISRAIRTPEWTYCVVDPLLDGHTTPSSQNYAEYQIYNNFQDPAQLTNLVARPQIRKDADALRDHLLALIANSDEARPEIRLARFYA